jgi:hypothetical protein
LKRRLGGPIEENEAVAQLLPGAAEPRHA